MADLTGMLIRREMQKGMNHLPPSKHGGSMKEEAHDSPTSSSGMCYKRDQPGHTMRDCHVLEVDHKEVKDQEGEQVRASNSRKETFFQKVKREMTAWEDSPSVSDSLSTLMNPLWQNMMMRNMKRR
ncbi:hypothetical protein KY284_012721 [Solanum tuberosum]|nr:hypothetical protein KY284_012721 [Solanum tuberosum]